MGLAAYKMLLFVFSACGGMHTGIKKPVLTACLGILGKGGLFMTYCADGLLYPNENRLSDFRFTAYR